MRIYITGSGGRWTSFSVEIKPQTPIPQQSIANDKLRINFRFIAFNATSEKPQDISYWIIVLDVLKVVCRAKLEICIRIKLRNYTILLIIIYDVKIENGEGHFQLNFTFCISIILGIANQCKSASNVLVSQRAPSRNQNNTRS